MNNKRNLLLAFYGDDFTGSTDALEFLSRAGIKTVLFIEPPTPEMLEAYDGLQAIGVAGMTRSMMPAAMEAALRPAFEALKALGPRHVHYKICSTFDSSPQIGSIGKALDVGDEVFKGPFIPLLAGAPALGRYCAFGNLFARMGIGSKGEIFRLDRHPSMSRHPVTPADESDLRAHLSHQTRKAIGLVDVLKLGEGAKAAGLKLASEADSGKRVVLFDTIYESHLAIVGKLIDQYAANERPLFSVGSSGLSMALGKCWSKQGTAQEAPEWPAVQTTDKMLVVSGSCSPVTARQIIYAKGHGFAEVALDTPAFLDPEKVEAAIAAYAAEIAELLDSGASVIMHTSLGTDDLRFEQTYRTLTASGLSANDIRTKTAEIFGTALGRIAVEAAAKATPGRIVIAGGDTSSFVARAMGIQAAEMIAPVTPGAPLCKAYAPGSPVDGLEIIFKGGQVGGEEYFETVLHGNDKLLINTSI